MIWADRTAKLWFIPFFLLLVLGFFFIRGSSFANWWRRWSSRLWTAQDWSNKDRSRLVAAWELRPAGVSATSNGAAASTSAESGASPTVDRWQTPSLASVLTKSESATLALTEDQELKDWLLEKMVSSRKEQRASIRNAWATILLGAGHCLIGLVVLLVAISVFGSLLEIIHGLAGGRP